MTQKHLAVFDWNATLFDDTPATYNATNECLAFFDIPPISLERLQDTFTFPLIHFYEKSGVSVDDYLKNTSELSDIFHTKYNELKTECTLMKGARQALNFCKNHNMHCMILSNYNQAPLETDIQHFNLEPYFETISGNKDPEAITSHTNKYERLRDYMNEHGFTPEQTFIIGDSHEEPELARLLNILGISITGGLLSPTRLEKCKKDHVITDLTELPDILEKEWSL